MNVARFFEHWGVAEDPFRAEEARQDGVFLRLGSPIAHPDFDKVLGDIDRPSTAIVFGEKGAGKTAIRLQLERRVQEHNAARPEASALLVPYDDLNPILDRLHEHIGGKTPSDSFRKTRLVDHMDGVLSRAVGVLMDAVIEGSTSPELGDAAAPASLVPDRRALRRLDDAVKRDLLVLQAVYDPSPVAAERTARLRVAIRPRYDGRVVLWRILAVLAWLFPAAVAAGWWSVGAPSDSALWLYLFLATAAVSVALSLKVLIIDRWRLVLLARRILSHAPVLRRSRSSLANSLAQVPADWRSAETLPVSDSDEPRYTMFERLRRSLAAFGCRGVIVVVDRVDEPTLISGDPDRMRAVIWPLLNNKLLQMPGYGFKLLLPIELRHALFRETTLFFQEARLDKQNLVERLAWSGATLYDLCNARLAACLKSGAAPITLRDLFDPDVSRQDLVDALDQMRRPRDAFKLLYRCVQEHCANITEDAPQWTVPRLILELVRKREADRVEQLNRGVRPA